MGVNDDGSYTFSTADGKKLSMDEKYSSTPLDKAHTAWTLEQAATEGCYYIKNVGRSSYLEWYAEKNNWSVRCCGCGICCPPLMISKATR